MHRSLVAVLEMAHQLPPPASHRRRSMQLTKQERSIQLCFCSADVRTQRVVDRVTLKASKPSSDRLVEARRRFSKEYGKGNEIEAVRRELVDVGQAQATQSDAFATSTYYSDDPFPARCVVKEGDTLTSISKKYETSIETLALANDIKDMDILFAGQVLLIPSLYRRVPVPAVGADEFPIPRFLERKPHLVNVSQHTSSFPQRISMFPPPVLNFAKVLLPALLIAPILGFAVRCVVDAIYYRIDLEVARRQAEKEGWDARHRPKVRRWQGILEEDREDTILPKAASTDKEPKASAPEPWSVGGGLSPSARNVLDSDLPDMTEDPLKIEIDEEQVLRQAQDYEDIQKSYAELEPSYMKFLADSGLSKSGYWRGGVPTPAHDTDLR